MAANNSKYELMPFQVEGVQYLSSRKYALLADDMGLGKTIQALAACQKINATKIIIICPASLCLQWAEKAKEFYPNAGIYVLNASFIKKYGPYWNRADILITSYNTLTSMLRYNKIDPHSVKFDVAVLDEAHFLKNHSSHRTKRILGKGSILHVCDKVWLMTGTPILNRPIELFIILKTFIPEKLGKYLAWSFYVRQFCGYMGKGAKNTDQLAAILGDFMLRRTKEQVLEQLPAIVETIVKIEGIKVPAQEFLPTERRLIGVAKIDGIVTYVNDILETIDKVFVIVYHREVAEELQKRLEKHNPVSVLGGMANDAKRKQINEFIDGKSNVLIGQIQTVAFGVDGLQRICNRVVFAECDWSPGTIAQAIDRLRRIGQTEGTVFVDYIQATGTLDEEITEKVEWKRDIIKKITKDDDRMAPYGWRQDEFERFPKTVQGTIASIAAKSVNDHGPPKREQVWEIKQKEKLETEKMARPKKDTTGEPAMSTDKVGSSVQALLGVFAKLVAHEVVGMMSGAGGPGEQAIPAILSQVQTTPQVEAQPAAQVQPALPTHAEVTETINKFIEDAQLMGISQPQAIAFYKEKILEGMNAAKIIEVKAEHLPVVLSRAAAAMENGFALVKNTLKPASNDI